MADRKYGTAFFKMFFVFFLVFLYVFLIEGKNTGKIPFEIKPVKEDFVGTVIYDVNKDSTLLSINGDSFFKYASNVKMITALVALEKLGGGFRFETLFKYLPESETLYVKAGGNPEMVIEEMWRMAKDLRSRGVGQIKRVVVDDFLYGENSQRLIPGSYDGDRSYQAYISPLSLNYNSVRIVVSSEAGKKPMVVSPENKKIFSISNKAVFSGKGSLVVGTRKDGEKTGIMIRGSLPSGRKPRVIYRKVFNPVKHYVHTLVDFLQDDADISITREKIDNDFFSEGITYRHKSRPLREILRKMNLYSSNFIAESVTFFMGAKIAGDAGKGAAILKKHILDKLGENVDIINGSGLGSSGNRIKPSFFVELMKYVYRDPLLKLDFFSTLPVLGEEGTLEHIEAYEYRGKFRGKTGTLRGVASISGIMVTKKGTILLITFVVNNFPGGNFKNMWKYRDEILGRIWRHY